jgi:carboxyl-terminal processing protease
MNKKLSLGVCISLVAIACAITFVLTTTVSMQIYNTKIAGVNEREEIYSKLQELDSYVRGNYIGTIDNDAQLLSILNGYIAGTGDVNAAYLTQDDYYEERQKQMGRLVTAGFSAVKEESGYIRISEVYEESSAMAQGVQTDDIITAVDGIDVLALGADEALKRLQGEDGTILSVDLQRGGEAFSLRLIRQEIELRGASGVIVDNVGYIRISEFTEISGGQFVTLIDSMAQSGVSGFIFDIRATDGYLLQPLKEMLERIMPAQEVASAVYKSGSRNIIVETRGANPLTVPVVVIADGGTSALGELFVSALREFAGAKVVGSPTKGNAVLQNVQSFLDGSAVKLSVAKIVMESGPGFDGVGLRPDYLIEMAAGRETNLSRIGSTSDLQVKKAFEVLQAAISSPDAPLETTQVTGLGSSDGGLDVGMDNSDGMGGENPSDDAGTLETTETNENGGVVVTTVTEETAADVSAEIVTSVQSDENLETADADEE